MTQNDLQNMLREGLETLECRLDDKQVDQLLAYVALLSRWNKAYNLTAIDDPEAMLGAHILDSLSILPYLEGSRFIDVGTGPGLPGIPLAVALPGKDFTLLDSNGKKTRFVFQALASLELVNAREVQSRVEDFKPGQSFDGVISRAFASIPDMIGCCGHLLTPGGRFYAMKGRYPGKELREIPKPYKVYASRPLQVPGVGGERHLLEIGISP